MPKTDGFINRDSKNGEFSPKIKKEINAKLNIYCQINGMNKSQYINNVLEKDLDEKFIKLKEETV